MPTLIQLALLAIVLSAACFDLRIRQIPNWLNVSGVVLGIFLNACLLGSSGALLAVEGLAAALCVYVPLYALKGMGAGDVKLMAAVGALVGPANWLYIFVVTALLGGLAAVVLILFRKRTAQTLHNLAVILQQLSRGKRPADENKALSIYNDYSLKMPHGAIIASGACLFLVLHRNV